MALRVSDGWNSRLKKAKVDDVAEEDPSGRRSYKQQVEEEEEASDVENSSIDEDSTDEDGEVGENSDESEEVVEEAEMLFTVPYKLPKRYFSNRADFEVYKTYRKEFIESDGFDVETFALPPDRRMIMELEILTPVLLEDGDRDYEYCKKSVQSVIRYQNAKDNTCLEFVKISRANAVVNAFLLYVTFEVRDPACGGLKLYQTMLGSAGGGRMWLFLFRQKVAKRAIEVHEPSNPIEEESADEESTDEEKVYI